MALFTSPTRYVPIVLILLLRLFKKSSELRFSLPQFHDLGSYVHSPNDYNIRIRSKLKEINDTMCRLVLGVYMGCASQRTLVRGETCNFYDSFTACKNPRCSNCDVTWRYVPDMCPTHREWFMESGILRQDELRWLEGEERRLVAEMEKFYGELENGS